MGVAFTGPKPNAKVKRKFTVKVKVTNFKLAPKAVGKAPQPGKGHIHFSLDGGKYDFPRYSAPNGKLADKYGTAGKYSEAFKPTITYRKIPRASTR